MHTLSCKIFGSVVYTVTLIGLRLGPVFNVTLHVRLYSQSESGIMWCLRPLQSLAFVSSDIIVIHHEP